MGRQQKVTGTERQSPSTPQPKTKTTTKISSSSSSPIQQTNDKSNDNGLLSSLISSQSSQPEPSKAPTSPRKHRQQKVTGTERQSPSTPQPKTKTTAPQVRRAISMRSKS